MVYTLKINGYQNIIPSSGNWFSVNRKYISSGDEKLIYNLNRSTSLVTFRKNKNALLRMKFGCCMKLRVKRIYTSAATKRLKIF